MPPDVVSWNDADDNNAFHSKLMAMDFDGSISTELALQKNTDGSVDVFLRFEGVRRERSPTGLT